MIENNTVSSRTETRIFVCVALIIGPLSVYASNWIPAVGAVAALAVMVRWALARSCRGAPLGRLPWLLAALLLWGALSAVWAVAPSDSIETVAKMSAVSIAALVLLSAALSLPSGATTKIGLALALGIMISDILISIEFTTHGHFLSLITGESLPGLGWTNLYNRSVSLLALLIWPACYTIFRRFGPIAALTLFGVTAAVASQTTSAAVLVALAFGALVGGAAMASPQITRWVFMAALVALLVALPTLPTVAPLAKDYMLRSDSSSGSTLHRLVIWEYVAARANERPVRGWGMDATRHLPGAGQEVVVATTSDGGVIRGALVSLHPHNGLLQVWLELGVPGVAAVFALLFLAIAWIGRQLDGRKRQATALAVFAAGAVLLELSFGVWQGWWQASLWVSAALTVAVLKPHSAAPA